MSGTGTMQGGKSIWVQGAQAAWLGLTLLLVAIFVAGLGPRYDELKVVCETETCFALALTPPDAVVLRGTGFTLEQYAVYHIGMEVVVVGANVLLAALILWRKADDPVALAFAFMSVVFYLNFMVEADASLYRLHPQLLPLNYLMLALGMALFLIVLFQFPNAQFIPHWARWIVLGVFVLGVIDPFLERQVFGVTTTEFSVFLTAVFTLSIVLGILAQIYQYRRVSTALERQQTKWVVFGFSVVVTAMVVWTVLVELFPLPPGPNLIFNTLIYAGLAVLLIALPLTILISILRYRLWDIDVLIRRTVSYAIIVALLAIVFFGSVILLQQLFASVTGSGQNELVTVLSTLAIAALFAPLRNRIQNTIDKRFNRQKYDAQQVLQKFGETVRDETDLEKLTNELVNVVEETMQPKSVTLWLKTTGDGRRATGK